MNGSGWKQWILALLCCGLRSGIPPLDVLEGVLRRTPPPCLSWSRRHSRLCRAVQCLREGRPLSQALRALDFSKPFCRALEVGERQGEVERLLDVLREDTQWRWKWVDGWLLVPFVVTWGMLAVILIYIAPNFGRISEELLGRYGLPEIARFGYTAWDGMLWMFGGLLLAVLLCNLEWIGLGFLYWKLPFVGRGFRLAAARRVFGIMHCQLAAGHDLPEALEAAAAAEPCWYLQRKLRLAAERIAGGAEGMGVLRNLNLIPDGGFWILGSGAARDRLPEAFGTVRELLKEAFCSFVGRTSLWLNIGLILLNAVLVFLVAATVFGLLSEILERLQ